MFHVEHGGEYEVVVVGGGHAGVEAAAAAARIGARTLLITGNIETIGLMSCNPAIGGTAKGHLVRELDALGGLMAAAADRAGIHGRRLNASKGPAVRATRLQADIRLYCRAVREALFSVDRLQLLQDVVTGLWIEGGRLAGIVTAAGRRIRSGRVVLATGTFLNGRLHIGLTQAEGGRLGDHVSRELSASLQQAGLALGRLKTGTPPRLDGRSIDFTRLQAQAGDEPAVWLSCRTEAASNPQRCCYLTRTTPETHAAIRAGLDRSPLYTGRIEGVGPRYCPSIEDKVVRFPARDGHTVFLEPQGLDGQLWYPNGISTSLPLDIQARLIATIPGLEQARIIIPGYAVEYDFVLPEQLGRTLELRALPGLYCAGQICGTSGYEEAAGLGFVAGVNAGLAAVGRGTFCLGRHEAYIGVMIDDLIGKGTREPYRMFTSRSEYRLSLREDNARHRLLGRGRDLGLVGDEEREKFERDRAGEERLLLQLKAAGCRPGDPTAGRIEAAFGIRLGQPASGLEIARRPETELTRLVGILLPGQIWPARSIEHVEAEIRYEGYIRRHQAGRSSSAQRDDAVLPPGFDYSRVGGLSNEARQALERTRPETLGQAGRLPGVTPAAIDCLEVHLAACRRGDVPRGT